MHDIGFFIWKYSHHFVVNATNQAGVLLAKQFSWRYVTYKLTKENGSYVRKVDKAWSAKNESSTQFRFHNNVFNEFRNICIARPEIGAEAFDAVVEEVPFYPLANVNLKFQESWTDKPEQVPPISWGLERIDRGVRTLTYVWQTGFGKSYMSTRCALHAGGRLVMILQPRYHQKWKKDFLKMLQVSEDDILEVSGLGKLADMTNRDWDNNSYPIVVISQDTFMDWLALYKAGDYKSMDALGFGVDPPNLMELLGAGSLLRDEVHECFHRVFIIDMFTHVPVTINVTATLLSDDREVSLMHELLFPTVDRNTQKDIKTYTEVVLARFNLADSYKIRTTERNSSMHSQAAIEKSLLKNRPLLNAYCGFIISLIEEHFISKREPDERCIVFCAFRVFIEHLHKELMKRFPDLKVMRYKSGEGEEAYEKNLLNADISITTKKSAGTAVDIPGLLTVIDAHLQSSSPAVIQALGRLRKLETKTPKYVPLVCTDWRKHTEYAAKLRITLNGRVKKIVTVDYGQVQPNKNHQR